MLLIQKVVVTKDTLTLVFVVGCKTDLLMLYTIAIDLIVTRYRLFRNACSGETV